MDNKASLELALLKETQPISGDIAIVRSTYFDRRFFTISDGSQEINLDGRKFGNISDIEKVTLVLNVVKKLGYNLRGTSQTTESTTEYTFQKV